jgi:hypothetical protein
MRTDSLHRPYQIALRPASATAGNNSFLVNVQRVAQRASTLNTGFLTVRLARATGRQAGDVRVPRPGGVITILRATPRVVVL